MTDKEIKLLAEENRQFLQKQLDTTRTIIKILGYSSVILSSMALYFLIELRTLLS